MADAATQVDIERLRQDMASGFAAERAERQGHAKDDDRRFGEVIRELGELGDSVGTLKDAHLQQVAAAHVIAEIAQKRANTNTWIVSLIVAACAIITVCIQKHWLGL